MSDQNTWSITRDSANSAWFAPQPSELLKKDLRTVARPTSGLGGTADFIEQAAIEIEVLNTAFSKALNGALSEKRLAKGKGYNLTKLLLTQLLSSTRTTATA